MSAEATINNIINNAISVANNKSSTSDDLISRAITASQTQVWLNTPTLEFKVNVAEPAVSIPSQADGINDALFQSSRDGMLEDLKEQFVWFFSTYFPQENTYLNAAVAWIQKALTTGGTGLNASVEDQIWQRDRARTLKESERAEQEIVASWASRGFPLPPGALAHGVEMIRQDARDKMSQASRDVAIKQAEMELENVRFAVQQAIDFRVKSINAAVDYIRALAGLNDVAVRLASSKSDAQARLISAAAEYYRARISVDELRFRAAETTAEMKLRSGEVSVDSAQKSADRVTNAAVTSAQVLGQQAAAALSAMHASVNLGNVTNQ